ELLGGQVHGGGLGQNELAAVAVDGRARRDGHLVRIARGDGEPVRDPADVEQAELPALPVQVVLLFVDEVLVLEELTVEETDPLLHHGWQIVIGGHDGPSSRGLASSSRAGCSRRGSAGATSAPAAAP